MSVAAQLQAVAYQSPSIIADLADSGRRVISGIADYRGRATRTDVWVSHFMAQFLFGTLNGFGIAVNEIGPAGVLANGLALLVFAALWIRRLHDIGYSGFWLTLPVAAIPLSLLVDHMGWLLPGAQTSNATMIIDISNLGWMNVLFIAIPILVMFLAPGQSGPNRYGENPRAGDPEWATT